MVYDLIFFCVLCCEMRKRIEAFNLILSKYTDRLLLSNESPQLEMLRKFMDSYRLIGKAVLELDGKCSQFS